MLQKTVRDSYLAALMPVLNYGVEQDLLIDNPTQGIKLKLKRFKLSREKGYTLKEAAAILKTSLAYAPEDAASHATREHAEMIAAKRWVPLLCAYTVARIAEITQLRKCDVLMHSGVRCIRISPDAGSVKSNIFRDVPDQSVAASDRACAARSEP